MSPFLSSEACKKRCISIWNSFCGENAHNGRRFLTGLACEGDCVRASARRSSTMMRCLPARLGDEGASRRRNWRRFLEFEDRKTASHVIDVGTRPNQGDYAICADYVNLRRGKLQVGFLFGRFSFVNDVTEGTWVCAIERLRNRLTERTALGIIDDHRRPCDGLERQPMQADCAAKRENRDDAANLVKHVTRLGSGNLEVNSGDMPMTSPPVVPFPNRPAVQLFNAL